MKIALCFHGLPRLLKQCNRNIIDYFIAQTRATGCIVDIYAHFWWDDTHKGCVNRLHIPEKYDLNEDQIQLFKELYNPVKVIYEDCPDDFDGSSTNLQGYNTEHIRDDNLFSKLMASIIVYGLYCRFVSATKVLDLVKEQGNDYDLIIICRTDLLTLEKRHTLLDEINGLNFDEYIYFPSTKEGGIKYAGEHSNRLGDWLFMGIPRLIYQFCSTSLDIIKNYEKYNTEICPIHNTERNTFWANHANVKLNKFNSSISIRRFIVEEWEDPSYRKSLLIQPKFYIDIYDQEQHKYPQHDLLPFYINKVKFIK